MEIQYCSSVKMYDMLKWGKCAVYGGRLSARREKGLKHNPLYDDMSQFSPHPDINGNMSPVHIITYESFPKQPELLKQQNGVLQNGDITAPAKEVGFIKETGFQTDKTDSPKQSNGVLTNQIESESRSSQRRREFKNSKNSGHFQLNHKESHESDETVKMGKESMQNTVNNLSDKMNVDELYAKPQKKQTDYTKGYLRNYGLLGYNNEGFVGDDDTEDDKLDVNTDKIKHKLDVNSDETNEMEKSDVQECTEAGNNEKPDPEFELSDTEYPDYETIGDIILEHDMNDVTVTCNKDLTKLSHVEIVTEVLVHKTDGLDSPIKHVSVTNSDTVLTNVSHKVKTESHANTEEESNMKSKDQSDDWPDIDELTRPGSDVDSESIVNESASTEPTRLERLQHTRSVSDVVVSIVDEKEDASDKGVSQRNDTGEMSSIYRKNKKRRKSNAKDSVTGVSSSTLKSILTNGGSVSHHSCTSQCEHGCQNLDSEIQEYKSVKFSKDTVFNENKSSKYKKEKFDHINLRDLYRGKIVSDSAVAKMNPLYQPDDDKLEANDDNEEGKGKLRYQLTVKHPDKLSKQESDGLNTPSYMEQYLIMKAHGLSEENFDIEKLPPSLERPVYDRLIQRTLAKERRKFCIKWSMVILTVAIITAIATTLGVYFKQGF